MQTQACDSGFLKWLELSSKNNNESQWEWLPAKTNFSLTYSQVFVPRLFLYSLSFNSLLAPSMILLIPLILCILFLPPALWLHLSLFIYSALSMAFTHFLFTLPLSVYVSMLLCQTDGSCPWQHGSNHLEGLGLFFPFLAFPPISMNSMCVNHVCSRHTHTLIHMTNCENTG